MTTAELSRLLFSPVTLVLYTGAMLASLYAMAFSAVDRAETDRLAKGRRARTLATVLAWLGVAAHVGHIVTRSIAADRLPLGNMFEFSSIIALTVVVAGLVVVQGRMKRPELLGFVLLGAIVTLGLSLLLYSDPGPLQPILDTWWRAIHVSTIALSAGLFSLAAVFNALHLLRDTAEVRVAEGSGRFGARSVGAAQAPTDTETAGDDAVDSDELEDEVDALIGTVPERIAADAPDVTGGVDADDLAYRAALRSVLTQRFLGVAAPWRLLGGVSLVTLLFSLIWWEVGTSVAMVATMAVLTLVAWWAVPFLPSATTLDKLTYRTIAFSFPIWTFAVITGAMWAEQSWGRFWGWDPKETSSFLTWVAYAGYLHSRATRGLKRRTASWLGLASFGVFLFTYYAVNLLVVGLHSYGGIDPTVGG
jgi:ABC-type transport system involved in cytochrome c biogenesis permease subunit